MLSAPADESAIELVHDLLAQLWAQHAEVPTGSGCGSRPAVIEVLANVVEHAFAARRPPNP